MRAVIQRVLEASVKVDGKVIGSCQKGYMILFCAMENDTLEDISLLAKKVALLRVFEDEDEKMNKSILDVNGEVLCISQFTLAADTRKGTDLHLSRHYHPTLLQNIMINSAKN